VAELVDDMDVERAAATLGLFRLLGPGLVDESDQTEEHRENFGAHSDLRLRV
jgi:hypothetical protein